MTREKLKFNFMSGFRLLGELPTGYEYKLIDQDGWLCILGACPDKGAIGFYIDSEFNLKKIEY